MEGQRLSWTKEVAVPLISHNLPENIKKNKVQAKKIFIIFKRMNMEYMPDEHVYMPERHDSITNYNVGKDVTCIF